MNVEIIFQLLSLLLLISLGPLIIIILASQKGSLE